MNAALTSAEPRRVAYLDGRWIDHATLSISAEDLGFRQGVVAVERLRTYGGHPFQVPAHLDRWEATLASLRIDRSVASGQEMMELNAELLRRNAAWRAAEGEFGITWFATPGKSAGGRGTLGLHLNRIDPGRVERRRRLGQPLVITDVVQPPPETWSRSIKVRCRLHYYLADQLARQHDSDASGVLLDGDGGITETSIANLAVVLGEEIHSPPADRVLGGITQQVVEPLAASAGIRWRKCSLQPETLRAADEVLLMGTDTGLWFAGRVDDQPIGDGGPGEIYRTLRDRFDQVTAGGAH